MSRLSRYRPDPFIHTTPNEFQFLGKLRIGFDEETHDPLLIITTQAGHQPAQQRTCRFPIPLDAPALRETIKTFQEILKQVEQFSQQTQQRFRAHANS